MLTKLPLKPIKNPIKSIKNRQLSYNKIKLIITKAIAKISPAIPKAKDGRIASALCEQKYLKQFRKEINLINPNIKVYIPSQRAWCDVFVADIPINLKITNGGTDNAFNKSAIHYTLFGEHLQQQSFNNWSKVILSSKIAQNRNKNKEYHYLVYNKKTKASIFKSILDIKEYKSSPSNILQINWNNEFRSNYSIKNKNHIAKKLELLKTVQDSIINAANQMATISNIDITKLVSIK